MNKVWRCECCGEMMDALNPAWRWTGDVWQHHQPEAMTHYDARPFGIDEHPDAIAEKDREIDRLREQVARDDEHYAAAMAMAEKHRKAWVETAQERDKLLARVAELESTLSFEQSNLAACSEENGKLRKRVAELEAAQAWRPISEFVPPPFEKASPWSRTVGWLVCYNGWVCRGSYYYTSKGIGRWRDGGGRVCNPTHFMPLPEPPK